MLSRCARNDQITQDKFRECVLNSDPDILCTKHLSNYKLHSESLDHIAHCKQSDLGLLCVSRVTGVRNFRTFCFVLGNFSQLSPLIP